MGSCLQSAGQIDALVPDGLRHWRPVRNATPRLTPIFSDTAVAKDWVRVPPSQLDTLRDLSTPPRFSGRRPAAVDHQCRTGHQLGSIGRQVDHGAHHVVDPANAPERDFVGNEAPEFAVR